VLAGRWPHLCHIHHVCVCVCVLTESIHEHRLLRLCFPLRLAAV
jgi:hypothetical protein